MSVIETFVGQILPYLILGGVIGFFLSKLTSNNSKSSEENMKAMKAAFVEIAREERERLQENIEGDMQEERTQRDQVNTLVETLTRSLNEAKTKWTTNTQALDNSLTDLIDSHIRWEEALSNPGLMGGMAEDALEVLLERAGFEEGTHFEMQPRTEDKDGNILIPDCYIYLPDDGVLVIDSKAPMKHFSKALKTNNAEKKAKLLEEHAKAYITYAKALKKKDYTSAVGNRTVDTIFMFVPNAAVYLAAVGAMNDLEIQARKQSVSIVPPQMLYPAIKTVMLIWTEKQMSENQEEIKKMVYLFQDRVRVFYADHFANVGSSLKDAVEFYNKAIASWNSYLAKTLRDVEKEMKPEKTVEPLDEIEEMPHEIKESDKK